MAMVMVQDVERALRFYRDLLGFTVQEEQEDWVFFAEGVGLQRAPEPLPDVAFNVNAVVVTLFVEDVARAYAELTGQGVAFFLAPTESAGVTVATFRDTENNLLQLLQIG
jgi:catechol 2,3-dioxygenase-like lactoylglutathione lyase family enzyme